MNAEEQKRNVPLALELGYKFTLHATYFDAIKYQTIAAKNFSNTIRYIREDIQTINEYWVFFFGSSLDKPSKIDTNEALREYLGAVLRRTRAKIHIHYGDPVEAAFELGAFFALNDLSPPKESKYDIYLSEIRGQLQRLGIDIDDALEASLPNLLSDKIEIRFPVRTEIFDRIEKLFGERVATSWLKGFEVNAAISGI